MKYKQVSFNMTLAQRISDGSVSGKVFAKFNGSFYGKVKYIKCLGNNRHLFKITSASSDDEDMTFNQQGEYVVNPAIRLYIEIPVENSYDDDYCNANSGVKEKQEQEKDGHYHKCKIEPIEYILANNLGFCEGNVVKYITRYKDKGGVDDLRKIKIYVDYLIDELTNKD